MAPAASVASARRDSASTTTTTMAPGGPTSPIHSRPRSPTADGAAHDGKGPAKRARKAINCEPCRNSKLKCDRSRPCSSCVLRGTVQHCYQGQDAYLYQPKLNDDLNNPSNNHGSSTGSSSTSPRVPIDPVHQFAQIRHALSLLESHVVGQQSRHHHHPPLLTPSGPPPPPPSSSSLAALDPHHHPPQPPPPSRAQSGHAGARAALKLEPQTDEDADLLKSPAPGANGRSDPEGFYAGPTSSVVHLASGARDSDDQAPGRAHQHPHQQQHHHDGPGSYEHDADLRAELPHASIVDGLVDYYFEYANWIYRHVNERAFHAAWARYKAGAGPDRLVLATVCMIMAVALHYLPDDHELRRALAPAGDTDALGFKWYNTMRTALQRRQAECRTYTLELVELLLIRTHFLYLAKIDTEETWAVKGELVTIGPAMGLHRDPGERMPLEIAERRRWAWWHIILLERWVSFMHGRPTTIASHHFDTKLPSYVDPTLDPTGTYYDANLALFRLAHILADIMDDAVSLRPVAYERVRAHDGALQAWWDALPPALALDDRALASSLGAPATAARRLGVQSLVVRMAALHIRFTLHRPYASKPVPFSRERAIHAADALIALVARAHPEILFDSALAVPGHMNWAPMHVFSAAMFFVFALVDSPTAPNAHALRQSVIHASNTLDRCVGMSAADKARRILHELRPLYSEEFLAADDRARERRKREVLPRVRALQFPYHDSGSVPLGAGAASAAAAASPSSRAGSSPGAGGPRVPTLTSGYEPPPAPMGGLVQDPYAAPDGTMGNGVGGSVGGGGNGIGTYLPSLDWQQPPPSQVFAPPPGPPPAQALGSGLGVAAVVGHDQQQINGHGHGHVQVQGQVHGQVQHQHQQPQQQPQQQSQQQHQQQLEQLEQQWTPQMQQAYAMQQRQQQIALNAWAGYGFADQEWAVMYASGGGGGRGGGGVGMAGMAGGQEFEQR